VRHLDRAVRDQLQIARDLCLDLGRGHRTRNFTVGFCVEEQAVRQATASGDDRYARRAELIGPDAAPLAVAAGEVIFGDPDTRFGELTGLLLDTIGRLRR
jgi:hypothetical protein